MFGYVTILQPELKIKDYDLYRSFYCGLCRALKKQYGLLGQSTLSYDMTFLALLLSALYEPETTQSETFCLVHPGRRHPMAQNRFSEYAAAMNVLLSYYKLKDDWADEKKLGAKLTGDALKRSVEKIRTEYPRQAQAVREYVEALGQCEAENSADLDLGAGLTGKMLAELFVPDESDVWAAYLRKIGFYLGKFIYLMDAYEDLEKDEKKGNYNVWLAAGVAKDALRGKAHDILTMMMSECSLAFEHLPILLYEDLLRNILYAGVWTRFEAINQQQDEKAAKEKAKESAAAKDAEATEDTAVSAEPQDSNEPQAKAAEAADAAEAASMTTESEGPHVRSV